MIDELAAEDLGGVPVAALGDDLVVLRTAINRLEAEFARRLAVFDARGGADADVLSTQAWLQHRCRLAPNAASLRVAVARRLDALPVAAAAFAGGGLSLEHVRAIATVRDDAAYAAVVAAEGPLVEYAAQVTPLETGRLVRHIVHAALPEILVRDEEETYQRRWLNISETFEGCVRD